MMENTNEMTIIFDSRPVNEALARVAVASFCTQLNPTLEEISDLKTAVSEAVTNCIIHGYEGEIHKIRVECRLRGQELQVDVTDFSLSNVFYNVLQEEGAGASGRCNGSRSRDPGYQKSHGATVYHKG